MKTNGIRGNRVLRTVLALAAAAGISAQGQALAQNATDSVKQDGVEISPRDYSFGNVDGSVDVLHGQFTLYNRGSDDVRLTEVVPACHCTRVKWSDESVAPGDSCVIAFDYSIDAYSTSFSKNIMVMTSRSEDPLTLTVSGRVVESDLSLAQKYPFLHGVLGLEKEVVTIKKVYKGETGVEIVRLANRSGKAVDVAVGECSDGVSAEMIKSRIAPKGEGFLRVKVSPEGKWGWNEYSVTPIINGEVAEPVKVRAMRVPDFRNADAKTQDEGPYPLLSSNRLTINVPRGQKSGSAKLGLENVSKAELEIYAAQVPDERFKVSFEGRVAANASTSLGVSVDVSGLSAGTYYAKLYLITNSAALPVSEVNVIYEVK